MSKVYVGCKFRPEDSRVYTYEWEGEPLKSGDIVKVADKSVDGWKRVTVVSITDEAPHFACKPILGLYNPDVEPGEEPNNDAARLAKASTHDPLDLSDHDITF